MSLFCFQSLYTDFTPYQMAEACRLHSRHRIPCPLGSVVMCPLQEIYACNEVMEEHWIPYMEERHYKTEAFLVWKRKFPKKVGWYFIREKVGAIPDVVNCYELDGEWQFYDWNQNLVPVDDVKWWAGPTSLPKEAKEKA